MRAVIVLHTAVSAATLLAACTPPTGPGAASAETEIVVLTVAPASATIDGGAFIKLQATVSDGEGSLTKPAVVNWSSTDPAIATVGADGLVEGRRAGEVRIVATWKSAHGSAWVRVARAMKPTPETPDCLKRLPVPVKNVIPSQGC